jgi:hypothetical protein
MIKEFKDNDDIRDSALIFKSTFEQIKKLYEKNPAQAGELAISAIELALTGQISSDDFMIDLMLENIKVVNERNVIKYNKKVEAKREERMKDLQLEIIAELHLKGLKQRQIGDTLGISQQLVSSRLAIIRTDFPELLEK